MKEKENKEKIFQCACHSEGLSIQLFTIDNNTVEYAISIWYRGFSWPLLLRERLSKCWKILIGQPVSGEEVIFDESTLKAFRDEINKILNEK